MKSIAINLNLAENVKKFDSIVNKYDYDMDVRSGRHVVNAKSILGSFSLDLNLPVILEIYNDNCNDLIEELKPFMA